MQTLIKTFLLAVLCLSFSGPARADLAEMEEKPKNSGREAIFVLKEEFDRKECRFRHAKVLIVGNFDPSYYYRFQVSSACIAPFLSKYSLTVKQPNKQPNFILLNEIRPDWWRPEELEEYIYCESPKKGSDNSLYYFMYDVSTEIAYLYLQDF